MKKLFLLLFLFICASVAFSQASLKKADKYFELLQYDKAVEAYQKAIDKNPQEQKAYFQIADCYFYQNKLSQAIEWYEKKINDQDIDSTYINHYAQALRSSGSLNEAKIWFKILISKDSVVGTHYYKLCENAQLMKQSAPTQEIKNEFINTASKEFAPCFYKNDLVFASGRTDIAQKGKKLKIPNDGKAFNRLFESTPDQNGYLKPPSLFHSELQDDANDMPLCFSEDNKWVVFTKGTFYIDERPFSRKARETSLYIAKVNDAGTWIDVKALPFNKSGYSDTWPFLDDNGKKLYFASNRPGGHGGYDIYVSQKFGDKWSEPANIGTGVNTQGDEISPFVSGNRLFYSSDWLSNYGGFDVCSARKDAGKWIDADALNTGINSSYDDYAYVWNTEKNIGYLTSNRMGGKGADDIYRVKNIGAPYTLVVMSDDNQPINLAIVDATTCGLGMLNTNDEGKVFLKTLPKEKCTCTISLDGYDPQTIEIRRDEVLGSQTRKILLKPRIIEYTFHLLNKDDGKPVADIPVEIATQAGEKVLNFKSDEKGIIQANLTKDKMYFFKTQPSNYLVESKLIDTSLKSDEKAELNIVLEPTKEFSNSQKSASDKFYRSKGLYAIQIATLQNGATIDFDKYNRLLPGVKAYTISPDANTVKLRMGNYASKSDAQNALRILNQNDIKNCFIVEDADFGKVEKAIITKTKEVKTEPKIAEAKEEIKKAAVVEKPNVIQTEMPKEIAKEMPKPEDNFRVRIAAVRDAKFADDPALAELGTILLEPAGAYTRVYVAYYKTAEEAKASLVKAIQAGFKDAYVCKKSGNSWTKLK